MEAKLEIFSDKRITGNPDIPEIPVLRLEAENEEDKEIIDKIFAAEKLVPVAKGNYPNIQDQDGEKNRIVSLILE